MIVLFHGEAWVVKWYFGGQRGCEERQGGAGGAEGLGQSGLAGLTAGNSGRLAPLGDGQPGAAGTKMRRQAEALDFQVGKAAGWN